MEYVSFSTLFQTSTFRPKFKFSEKLNVYPWWGCLGQFVQGRFWQVRVRLGTIFQKTFWTKKRSFEIVCFCVTGLGVPPQHNAAAKAHDICMEMCISIAFLYRMKAAYNHVTSPQKASSSTHAKEKGRESLRKIFATTVCSTFDLSGRAET